MGKKDKNRILFHEQIYTKCLEDNETESQKRKAKIQVIPKETTVEETENKILKTKCQRDYK